MEPSALSVGEKGVLDLAGLQALIDTLTRSDYLVLGPVVRDGAIVLSTITSIDDFPKGWGDDQSPGGYRLNKRRDAALFGYAVGSHSWKSHFHPPLITIFRAERTDGTFSIAAAADEIRKTALLGVRPCDLAAIAIQDRVLMRGDYSDAAYQARRKSAFVVVVNCGEPGGTCFCASMGTGPRATSSFDLALTEVVDREEHCFLLEVGSKAGAEIATQLPVSRADEAQIASAEKVIERAVGRMGRNLPTNGLKDALQQAYEHPRWEEVATRCLTCGNCTSVCPTCFCTTVEDYTDLAGESAERKRRWDSCFTLDFSYIFGGSVRPSVAARYRQWLLHKLANWHDQFGTPGCVGCGRCITWCPVGIDITAEAEAIRTGVSPDKEHTRGNP